MNKDVGIENNIQIINSRAEIPDVVQNDIATLQKWGDRVEDEIENFDEVPSNHGVDGKGFESAMSKSQRKKLWKKQKKKSNPNVIETRGRAVSEGLVQ